MEDETPEGEQLHDDLSMSIGGQVYTKHGLEGIYSTGTHYTCLYRYDHTKSTFQYLHIINDGST